MFTMQIVPLCKFTIEIIEVDAKMVNEEKRIICENVFERNEEILKKIITEMLIYMDSVIVIV